MSTPDSRVAKRYGQRENSALSTKLRWWLIGGALVVMVAIVAAFNIRPGGQVTAQDLNFQVIDETRVDVSFRVTKNPEDTAFCAVQAMEDSDAVTGWKVIEIPANSPTEAENNGRTTSYTVSLRTDAPGTTGNVNSCWLVQ